MENSKDSGQKHHGSEATVSSSTSQWIDKDENKQSADSTSSTTSSSSSSGSQQQDQNFTAADSNSGSNNSRSSVPCKVCGDKASGYHYGVTSCEGCKGFFRRSIQKQIEYRCLRDGKCLVIRLNRNRCQHCRFKKCLAVGMSRDSVRYGRVPKRSRERMEENRVIVSEADQSAWDTEKKEKELEDFIKSMDDFQISSVDANGNTQATADSLQQQKMIMWQHFAHQLSPCIQMIVELAKRYPGFNDLSQDDQIILIKQGFFEVWLVQVSKHINPSENTITFVDGTYITRQQAELIFDYEFVTALFNFVSSLHSLQLTDTEMALLSAIVLFMSDREGVFDIKGIDKEQERVIEALKHQVMRNHSDKPHLFQALMLKVQEIRALGSKHSEHLLYFRSNWSQVELPALFAETFDINNCVVLDKP